MKAGWRAISGPLFYLREPTLSCREFRVGVSSFINYDHYAINAFRRTECITVKQSDSHASPSAIAPNTSLR